MMPVRRTKKKSKAQKIPIAHAASRYPGFAFTVSPAPVSRHTAVTPPLCVMQGSRVPPASRAEHALGHGNSCHVPPAGTAASCRPGPPPFRDLRQDQDGERESATDDRAAAYDAAAREAEAALALASEPTIERMVPVPSRSGDEGAEQAQPKADASLVARGALKSGYLWKMGANVPKWKRRYFVLKPITMLFYYMSEHDTEPRGCIDLDLFDAVRKVREDGREDFSSAAGAAGESRGGAAAGGGSTTFELYRSGCPDGSGFMLEARGGEDWEQWVESIANGRHGKMLAEMDVVKGANKVRFFFVLVFFSVCRRALLAVPLTVLVASLLGQLHVSIVHIPRSYCSASYPKVDLTELGRRGEPLLMSGQSHVRLLYSSTQNFSSLNGAGGSLRLVR